VIGLKEITMSGRRTRASTRTNATNGANGRGDGGATKPKLRTYATEDGERPVKRTRGEAAATTTTTTTEAKKKKKPKILGKAFAAVLAAREKSKAAHVAATEAASAKANEKKGKAGKASGASAALAAARAAKAAKAQAKSMTMTSTTALVVAPENAKPTKGKKATAAAATAAVPKRKYWKMVNLEGVIFSVGDSVYVVSDNTEDFDEDEDVPCTKCGEAPEPDRIMLECDTCLRGWHMSCLKPPLTEVPESDWNCPLCTRGGDASMAVPSAASTARTACTEFMAGRLHLARIEHIWEENGEYQFAGRWYALPEETHMGRQPIQHRREVFLTHTVDINPVDCLFRVARVCTPQEFRDEEGPDAYVCEYTYDAAFQRFKRRGEWDDDEEFSDDERFDQEIDWKNDKDDGHEWNDSKKSSSNKKAIKGRLAALTARRRAEDAAAQLEIAGMGSSALGRARRHPSTVLGGVRAVLSLASTPASLPCREVERKQIYDFVHESIVAGPNSMGKCLYISGVPGTGKTATVREIIRVLRSQARNGLIPKFNHVELNALRLQTPKHAYSTIAEELMGQKFSPEKGNIVLDKRFKEGKGSDGRVTVLILDELDLLVTRKQEVLYNIFEWPTHKKSRLVVIGIANTLDVPERLLPRIASRLGSNRVAFAPYSWEQLKKIVTSRLESLEGCSDAYAPSTLDLICRKVASVNGDARRALELARRAAEVAEARINVEKITSATPGDTSAEGAAARAKARTEKVTMEDVRQAQSEMFDGPHMKLIHAASFYERMFLVALVKSLQMAGTTTVDMGTVMQIMKLMCKDVRVNVPEPPIGSGTRIASRLRSTHLILSDSSTQRNLQQLSLSVPTADVTFALVENAENSDMPWVKLVL
jgi:origin recognition complex subunit 1